MKLILALLLTCSLARAAVQDDLARAFLLNVLANNAVPVLTNLVVPPLTNATVLVVTNIARQAGASSSNAVVGGVIYVDPLSHTNLNGTGTLTNLAAISIPALTLLNIGDAIRCEWGGKMPVAAGTNQFTIVYGATTILDTGLQAASNRVFKATAVITRTGASAQHVEAYFSWGERNAPLGTLFSQTNVNISMTENNAVANVLALRGAARRVGGHTNNSFRVFWEGIK